LTYIADFTIYCLASSVLSLFYIYIIWRYVFEWGKVKLFKIPVDYSPSVFVSVLIPARNEAENIGQCLDSILQQTYPSELFEVIVIDDHSEDETPQIVKNINDHRTKLLKLADFTRLGKQLSFKKKAIEIGISNAKGQLIVTTDADCFAPKSWLKTIAAFYETKQLKFIAAPVNFHQEKNLFERFQSLDFLGMMGVTGAGIRGKLMNMCNGANLAYEKKVFEEVDGFEGIDHLASGDDMLLMQKIAQQFPNKIGFLKNTDAVILTKAQPTLSSFMNQRIRWASKTSAYKEWKVTMILILVFLFCVNIVLSFFLIPFFGFTMALVFTFQLLIKIVMDYFFLNKMSNFFNQKDLMNSFLPAQFLHIVYIVSIGFLSVFVKKYYWKGRKTS
jgi:cellulose synthase/poly-beta-1,6-N-acetylglucosamine synthase-like glycosyltransferase